VLRATREARTQLVHCVRHRSATVVRAAERVYTPTPRHRHGVRRRDIVRGRCSRRQQCGNRHQRRLGMGKGAGRGNRVWAVSATMPEHVAVGRAPAAVKMVVQEVGVALLPTGVP
jgi:hypothetical protein